MSHFLRLYKGVHVFLNTLFEYNLQNKDLYTSVNFEHPTLTKLLSIDKLSIIFNYFNITFNSW